ncbi:MAG: NAD(P)H-quinone oxidoreductase subunit 3 [Fibrobacter sp.]|nr:NAD(P)H-quinone oxidoreductase subunit 3 [Fibrobacter sp.]
MQEYIPLIFFVFLGAFIASAAIITGFLLSYRTKESIHKHLTYECGVDLFGTARIQFKVGYYLYALLFLIFDIEALFLFPAVRIFNKVATGQHPHISPTVIFIELGLFITVVVCGLAYAWRKGALQWE